MEARKLDSDGVFRRVEYLGFRDEILGEMIEECKYESVRGLLDEIAEVVFYGFFLPKIDGGSGGLSDGVYKKSRAKTSADLWQIVLVPMPTSRKHVRERGFDHMDRICREIARLSEGSIRKVRLLQRAKDTVQVGASEALRQKQAKEAVRVDEKALEKFLKEGSLEVVLMDDVWTTGASLTEAGKMLRKAGVTDLSAIAITKNRAHKSPIIRRGAVELDA